MTSHQHRLSTRSMASVAASNAVSNEDEEEAYSYVEDLSSLSDNVVIITTEASDDKDISNVHNRGRSVQGMILSPECTMWKLCSSYVILRALCLSKNSGRV